MFTPPWWSPKNNLQKKKKEEKQKKKVNTYPMAYSKQSKGRGVG